MQSGKEQTDSLAIQMWMSGEPGLSIASVPGRQINSIGRNEDRLPETGTPMFVEFQPAGGMPGRRTFHGAGMKQVPGQPLLPLRLRQSIWRQHSAAGLMTSGQFDARDATSAYLNEGSHRAW